MAAMEAAVEGKEEEEEEEDEDEEDEEDEDGCVISEIEIERRFADFLVLHSLVSRVRFVPLHPPPHMPPDPEFGPKTSKVSLSVPG